MDFDISFCARQSLFKISKNRLQISLLKLSEFMGINELLFPLKSSENHRFSDHLR